MSSIMKAIEDFEVNAESSVLQTIEDFETIADQFYETQTNKYDPASTLVKVDDKINPIAETESKEKFKKKGKDYKCSKCDKVYHNSSNLKKHVISFHDKLKFECNFCNKMFSYGSLISHKKAMHRENEKLPCNQCGNLYANKLSLKCHVKSIHKRFICDICNQEFDRKMILNTHMKFTHSS